MKRDHIDFFLVADHHIAIHERLESWARWVRVRPVGWQVAPMFRQARSNSFQWHAPEAKAVVNIPEALEVEKAVSLLPEKHREAIRWCYVFPSRPGKVAQRLAVSNEGLMNLLNTARSMLRNQLRVSDGR